MAQSNQKNRGAFFLKESTLYVANDGNGFDRDGVNALCRPNLSAKGDLIIDNVAFAKDKDWLKALNNFQIESYVRDGNRLQTDKKEEDSTIQQYNGRWLLELLQNIDDAIGPRDNKKYIGTKGLGFLSTMEVANYPSIFSDVFDFTFSKEKTKEALSQKGFTAQQLELVPNFQVPWPAEDDKTIRLLKKEGFTTVIRFKIKEDHLEDVEEQLFNLDYYFLLFSQHIQRLYLEINGEKKYISREIKRISGNEDKNKNQISINIDQPGKKRKKEEWIRWQRSWQSNDTKKRSSTMFCLPFEKGKCKPFLENTEIYNFYPTDEPSDIKGFLHISFNLTRDRKRLEMWGEQKAWGNENCDPEDLKLISQINALVGEDVVGDQLVSPETIIGCFLALNDFDKIKDTKGRPEKQIKKTLINTIKEKSFIPRFGGGKTSINDLTLWEHNLLECLIENKKIQEFNFPAQNYEGIFKQLKVYECDELNLDNLITILAHVKIKNRSSSARKNIAQLIAQYSEKDNLVMFYDRNQCLELKNDFKKIAFLEDDKGALVSFNKGYFALNKIQIPSFIKVKQLSSTTVKMLNDFFINNEKIDETIQKWTLEGLIRDKTDLVYNVLRKNISKMNEAFWEKNGFELLSFLFQAYVKDRNILASLENINILVPEIKSGKWKPAEKAFFSRTWEKTAHLSNWFKEHAPYSFFEITSRNGIKEKILTKKQIEDNNIKVWNKTIHDFFQELNVNFLPIPVNRYPRVTDTEDQENGEGLDREYHNDLTDCRLISCGKDFVFNGLAKFLKRENRSETLFLLSQLVNRYKGEFASYYVHRGRTRYRPPNYPNFAVFQLYTAKSIKLTKSPIRPSGFYSLKEIYISDKPDKVFPRISEREAKPLSHFETYGLSENLYQNEEVWEKWVSDLPIGYKSLLDDNIELTLLNAQVVLFFEKYIEMHNSPILNYFPHLPVLPTEQVLEFFETDQVLWNDTDIDDDLLASILKNFNYGLFCLTKFNRVEKSDLVKSGLQTVSEVFKIEINEKRVDNATQSYFMNWLKDRWDIFSALNRELSTSGEGRLFAEIEHQLVICEEINISVVPSDSEKDFEPKYVDLPFFNNQKNQNDERKGLLFVKFDDKKWKLLQFLCNEYFQWKKTFSLLKDLFNPDNSDEDIRTVLKQNGLSPNLIEHFSALEKDQIYLDRKQQLQDLTQEKNIIQNDSGLLLPGQTQRDIQASNAKRGNNSTSSRSKSQTSDNAKKSQKSKKVAVSNDSASKSFGSRLSGHLRPRHDNEVTVRPYFNDEDDSNPENKRIGDMAEKYVFELLRQRNDLDGVQHLGKNNKGFDIEYKKDNDNYFVEVKGLSNNWDDSDVLLSRAQFQKAQEEGDKYSIYIVEYVEDDNRRRVSVLKDPSSYFTKMQIDHGWRNFAEELLLSTKD